MRKLFFLVALGGLTLFIGKPALAGPFDAASANLNKALEKTELPSSLTETVGTVVKAVLSLVGTIFLLLTIYAGILWMTAQGNEDQVAKSKSIIQAAVIGLIITLAAYAITAFVTGRLGGIAGNSSTTGSTELGTGNNPTSCSASGGTCKSFCDTGAGEVSGVLEYNDCGESCCYPPQGF